MKIKRGQGPMWNRLMPGYLEWIEGRVERLEEENRELRSHIIGEWPTGGYAIVSGKLLDLAPIGEYIYWAPDMETVEYALRGKEEKDG